MMVNNLERVIGPSPIVKPGTQKNQIMT